MDVEIKKIGTATWYLCPCCHERLVFINGSLISGKMKKCCPNCGQIINWNKDKLLKVSKWRRLRQAVCWTIHKKNAEECMLEVKTAHPNEVICGDCKHNLWNH